MKKTVLFLLVLLLGVPAMSAEPEIVESVWQPYYYSNSRYRGKYCLDARQALEDILNVSGARNIRAQCYWNDGLFADWESLTPVKEDAPKAAAAALLSSIEVKTPGHWLSGLSRRWEAAAVGEDDVLEAVWRSAQIQRFMSGVISCNAYIDVMDELFDMLPLKLISQSVFCNTGSSYIGVTFEYLELETSANSPK